MSAKISTAKVRGKTMWVVEYREGGKRRRMFRDTRGQARAEANRIDRAEAKGGTLWKRLNAAEQADLIDAYRQAQEKELDLCELIANARNGEPKAGPKLSDVIKELVAVKTKSGKSKGYADNLRIVLGQFAKGRESLSIGAVSLANVEKFLDARTLAYRPTLRARLSSLFKFAIRRGYRIDNPCSRLEAITAHHPATRIFTVLQVAKAVLWLKANRPALLSWFALSTFCGLRPEEAEKTTAKEINFDEGFIRVERQTTKVRQRRVVYPKPEALAFLKASLKAGGVLPMGKEARRYALDGLKPRLWFRVWPKDITRHTAASYWLADTGSTEHVADMLGHSEAVLRKNYKAIVTKEQAKRFWALVAKLGKVQTTT